MIRYKLRTLMIVLAIGPLLIAWVWSAYDSWHSARMREAQIRAIKPPAGGIGFTIRPMKTRVLISDSAEPVTDN